MPINDLINDLIINGVFALIGSRVARSIGEKDIGDIITGAGWAIIAVDIVGIAEHISSAVSQVVDTVTLWADKIEQFFSSGLLGEIINFGSKEQIMQWFGK